MNINEIYGGDYLKADDLQGQPRQLTISSWSLKEFNDGSRKIVLAFSKGTKTLVMNATNANSLGGSFGFDTDAWVGKTIELRPERVNFQGRMVDAIRAYPMGNSADTSQAFQQPAAAPAAPQPAAQPRPAAPQADFNDDIPW